ncbi:hypothetical protein NM688_g166 [Phlebia brevispora]|uniref:Uncharacterized protein n=1 Tax=Phlebia brevispora TaxID=194682 RepID=A0ACC1TFG0_9APHY|nr:hypothetical protein NM688_g166 [Phlebia brevispora]
MFKHPTSTQPTHIFPRFTVKLEIQTLLFTFRLTAFLRCAINKFQDPTCTSSLRMMYRCKEKPEAGDIAKRAMRSLEGPEVHFRYCARFQSIQNDEMLSQQHVNSTHQMNTQHKARPNFTSLRTKPPKLQCSLSTLLSLQTALSLPSAFNSAAANISSDDDWFKSLLAPLSTILPLPCPARARPRIGDFQVGYVYDTQMLMHECLTGHPEQPGRIKGIYDLLKKEDLLTKMRKLPIRLAEREEILLVHNEHLWDKVMAISAMNEQDIADSENYYTELSLYVHPQTPLASRLSCGGVIEATLAVARGQVKKSFAIVRPPGHHSEPDEHMGFCFFNNVAVAIRVMQQLTPLRKVLVLDWDIHHGNGTQRAFYNDSSVLYISLHRYENGQYYPNGPFGNMTSCGEGAGLGYSVNIPWPSKGMGDADYLHAFQSIVMPIAMEFAPELVIISSGFDAAEGDDLGECHVSPAGYAHMTHMLSSLAGGKLVVALEGGYNVDAISRSALAVARVLLGEAPPEIEPMVASEDATETVWQVAMEQSKYWKSVNPKALEPREEVDPVTFSIPEILKAHRQDYLFRTHEMLQIPFVNPALEERFSAQVSCTKDIMDNQTLVVFVHEFGNLRVELDSVTTCNVKLEHSYMVDFSKELISWVKKCKYALLDVNVFPKPFATNKMKHRSVKDDYSGDVMVYLWDNYVSLTEARRVILIGHGPGCHSMLYLLENRTTSVMKLVKGIVQVVGTYNLPSTPRDQHEMRQWYLEHSFVVVPKTHRFLLGGGKFLKRHGKVVVIDEPKPIKLVIRAFPGICTFVSSVLGDPAAAIPKASTSNGTSNINNNAATVGKAVGVTTTTTNTATIVVNGPVA